MVDSVADGQDLILKIEDGIAFATINRPTARNAMSSDVREALQAFLEQVRDNAQVRAVLIQATGDSFIAGGDVKAFGLGLKMTAEDRAADMHRRATGAGTLATLIATMPQPVIVAARGHAVGVGASVIFMADFAIVSDTVKVRLSHVGLGISPDGAATYFLSRQVGLKKAAEIAMLGDQIGTDDLAALGLVNWVVPDADLDARALSLAQRLAAGPAAAHREIKQLIQAAPSRDLAAQIAAEADALATCAATRDYAEGLTSILEKRRPVFGQQGN